MKIRTFFILFSFFLLSGFTDNQVWVKAKMPLKVHAGDKFTIEITINKLDLQHFAEYKQILPKGFTAKGKQLGGSDFSFNNQVVKYTWLRLPREQKIAISYEVQISDNVAGQFSLPGEFIYIYKNQRGKTDLKEDKINVYAKGESFKNELLTTNLSFPPKDLSKIQCIRLTPEYSKKEKGFSVKLLVSCGNLPGVFKIVETIPVGYSASIINSQNANVTYENNKLEFLWKKIPEKKNFEITYKVILESPGSIIPLISGKMIYLADGQDFNVSVVEIAKEKLK